MRKKSVYIEISEILKIILNYAVLAVTAIKNEVIDAFFIVE